MRLGICFSLVLAAPAAAQTAAESGAIRATALDYVEGWYQGSAKVDGRWLIVNVRWEREPAQSRAAR
jgi:hypothetical protein